MKTNLNAVEDLLEEVKDLITCKQLLFDIWDEVDPNAFPSHIWCSHFRDSKRSLVSKT